MTKHFGVVEGFYRTPYTWQQRRDLILFLADIGCTTYVYGPKADPYHRKRWQRLYPRKTIDAFKKIVSLCTRMKVRFNYALSPMQSPDINTILKKLQAMTAIGITDFSIFYDDIKIQRTAIKALHQARSANAVYAYLKRLFSRPTLFFCPTQYHGFKMTEYITTISRELDPGIEIFWTGKRVVSPRITSGDIEKITALYKRPPLIWDNLFANDYIPGIIHAFPYRFRAPDVAQKTKGVLINPMNNFQRSKPLIYTAAMFFKKPNTYVPREAWHQARRLFFSSH